MSIQSHRTVAGVGELSITEARSGARASSEIEVNVIFTDSESTLAALEMAGSLASNLGARINLVAAQVVPLVFPLTRPPVAVDYTEQRLLDLAYRGGQGPLETSVQLYLCRDKRQALLRALKPKSLVVIGGKARWWPTKESKLAGVLRSNGHQVVVANSNDKRRGAERRRRAPRGYPRKEATVGNAHQSRKYWWTKTRI